jgi:hypothetical protein
VHEYNMRQSDSARNSKLIPAPPWLQKLETGGIPYFIGASQPSD